MKHKQIIYMHITRLSLTNVFLLTMIYGIISGIWNDTLDEIEQNMIIMKCYYNIINNIINVNVLLFYCSDIRTQTNIVIDSEFSNNTFYVDGYVSRTFKTSTYSCTATLSIITSNIRLKLTGPTEFHENKFDVMIIRSIIVLHNYNC